jgi:hypothetical protein
MARHSTTETDADHVSEQLQCDSTMAAFDSVLALLEYIDMTMFKALDERGSDLEFLGMVKSAQNFLDLIRDRIDSAPRVGE